MDVPKNQPEIKPEVNNDEKMLKADNHFLIPKAILDGMGEVTEDKEFPGEVDDLILKLVALSRMYESVPDSESNYKNIKRMIDDFVELDEKKGMDLIKAHRRIRQQESEDVSNEVIDDKITPEEPEFVEVDDLSGMAQNYYEKMSNAEEEKMAQIRSEYQAEVKKHIGELLADTRVRRRYEELVQLEEDYYKSAKPKLEKMDQSQDDINDAKYRILKLKIMHLDKDNDHLTGLSAESAKKWAELVELHQDMIDYEMSTLNKKQKGVVKSKQLIKYKEQMHNFGLALTPSTEKSVDRIVELTAQGFKVFLGGPTGTGKTTRALFAIKQITDNSYDVISWSGETDTRQIFGRQVLKPGEEGGIKTDFEKGAYTKALTGEVRGVIHEEFTSGMTSTQISLKKLWATPAGEPVIGVPGFDCKAARTHQFAEIATGNLKDEHHESREEMDPAIAREFKAIDVPFMPAEEMKDIILATLIDESGFLPISRRELKFIHLLCRAAEFSQYAYLGQIPDDEKKKGRYLNINDSGDDIELHKVFLDTGTLLGLFKNCRMSGSGVVSFVLKGLNNFVNDNTHFQGREMEIERNNMIGILREIAEIDISPEGKKDPENENRFTAGLEEGDDKPYIMPSEMGSLLKVRPIDQAKLAEQMKLGMITNEDEGDGGDNNNGEEDERFLEYPIDKDGSVENEMIKVGEVFQPVKGVYAILTGEIGSDGKPEMVLFDLENYQGMELQGIEYEEEFASLLKNCINEVNGEDFLTDDYVREKYMGLGDALRFRDFYSEQIAIMSNTEKKLLVELLFRELPNREKVVDFFHNLIDSKELFPVNADRETIGNLTWDFLSEFEQTTAEFDNNQIVKVSDSMMNINKSKLGKSLRVNSLQMDNIPNNKINKTVKNMIYELIHSLISEKSLSNLVKQSLGDKYSSDTRKRSRAGQRIRKFIGYLSENLTKYVQLMTLEEENLLDSYRKTIELPYKIFKEGGIIMTDIYYDADVPVLYTWVRPPVAKEK